MPSLCTLQVLPHTPHCSPSNLWLIFPLIVVTWVYVHIDTYIFLYWVYMMLLVCIFSWLIIWHWTANCCSLPWERSLLSLPAFLICLWFPVQGWCLADFPPFSLACSLVSSSFTSHFDGHVGKTVQVQLLMLLGNTISQRLLILWLLQPFCLFCSFLSLEWGKVLCMCSLALGSTSMYFVWIYFPPVVSRRIIPMIWTWYIDHN